MKKINNGNLKLAVQKSGRLTEETINLLQSAGLEFEAYKQQLFSSCRNFPLEILYLRDNDIPDYVETGVVDLGIIGQNLINEKQPKVKKLCDLQFGYCSLVVAVLKESTIKKVEDLENLRVATSYPFSAKSYFDKKKIKTDIVKISGSVEVTPALGMVDAIVDLTSTGSTLVLNDLRIIEKIYDSQATLISNKESYRASKKKVIIEKLLIRLNGVLSAKNYKYIMMNAPENIISKLTAVAPGLKSPTISALAKKGWISIQCAIKEDIFWETIEKLKKLGASEILVLPIEKLIT